MGNILWEWRFKAHGNNNDDVSLIDIDQGVYGDNIVNIPLKWDENELLIEAYQIFSHKVDRVIEDILRLWKEDYLSLRERYVFNRDLNNELTYVKERMISEALTMGETLDYIEGAKNIYFEEHFKLNAIGEMLDSFRQEVFSILESNERDQRS